MPDSFDKLDAHARGFSLVELVLVVAIIASLAAIAVPRYARSIVRFRVESAARRIVADLDLARKSARRSSTSRTVAFTIAANTYRISGLGGLDDRSQDYAVLLSGEPYRAAIVSCDFGGDTEVVFDGYGVPDSGGTVTVRCGDIRKTVELDPETRRATIR